MMFVVVTVKRVVEVEFVLVDVLVDVVVVEVFVTVVVDNVDVIGSVVVVFVVKRGSGVVV